MEKRQRRLGIFGGSFDPVHCGHIELAQEARRELHLDKVFFVPARQPPHKKKRKLTAARKRLRLLSLATKPFPYFAISWFEIERRATTYTYETLLYFRRRYPGARLFFIIGSDSLGELATWKRASLLQKLCTFVTGKRPGVALQESTVRWRSIYLLRRPIRDVSSSAIRERIRNGKPIRGLVPASIARVIAEKGLYRQ
jgi:nicotinate-nucleotide adenylyltransferase